MKKTVSVQFEEELLAAIDRARGSEPRQRWLASVVAATLEAGEVVNRPAIDKPRRSSPYVSDAQLAAVKGSVVPGSAKADLQQRVKQIVMDRGPACPKCLTVGPIHQRGCPRG